ncbi:MAG: cyclic-di-AMP receptor [Chloroflexi bacterium]|nr:cyclic-di-AMP receptor [Chloroflexota bacterium]
MKDIDKHDNGLLYMAIVQAQDADIAEDAIRALKLPVTRLPSTGAFLGRRNATLLIGLPPTRRQEILKAFKENCRQRIEYIAVPLESAPLPLPSPTPITVGGATIFSLEVDLFEEF